MCQPGVDSKPTLGMATPCDSSICRMTQFTCIAGQWPARLTRSARLTVRPAVLERDKAQGTRCRVQGAGYKGKYVNSVLALVQKLGECTFHSLLIPGFQPPPQNFEQTVQTPVTLYRFDILCTSIEIEKRFQLLIC